MKRKLYPLLLAAILFILLFAACKSFTSMTYEIDNDSCIGCGRCMEACPHNAILYDGDKAVIIQSKCEQCGKCVSVCPENAIH